MNTPRRLELWLLGCLATAWIQTSCTPSPPPARPTATTPTTAVSPVAPKDAGASDAPADAPADALDASADQDAPTDSPYTKLVVLPPTDFKPPWDTADAGPDACSLRPKVSKHIPVWWKSPGGKAYKLSRGSSLKFFSGGCCGPQNVGRFGNMWLDGIGNQPGYSWDGNCRVNPAKPIRIHPGQVVFTFHNHDTVMVGGCTGLVVLSKGCQVIRHSRHLFLRPYICLAEEDHCDKRASSGHGMVPGGTNPSYGVTCTVKLEPGTYLVHHGDVTYPLTVPGVFHGDMWRNPPCRQRAGWGKKCTDAEWKQDEASRKQQKENCKRWRERKERRDRERRGQGW